MDRTANGIGKGAGQAPRPLIWVLEGLKAGDNTQMQALARQVARLYEWRVESRYLRFRGTELLTNLTLRVTTAGLSRDCDRPMPPWPDVVITAGRRNEPVARWIRRQSPPPAWCTSDAPGAGRSTLI